MATSSITKQFCAKSPDAIKKFKQMLKENNMEDIATLKILVSELKAEEQKQQANYEMYSRNRDPQSYGCATWEGKIKGLSLAEKMIQSHIDNIYQ